MAVFEQQVEDYIGEDVAGTDIAYTTAMLDQWMQDGANYIITSMPDKLLHLFSNYSAEKTASPYAYEGAIAGVDREADVDGLWTPCKYIHHNFLIEMASLATATAPMYTVYDGGVYVKPDPGATTKAFKVLECVAPTIDASANSNISNFPNTLEQYVVAYAAAQIKQREAAKLRRDAQDEFEALINNLADGTTGTADEKILEAWNLIQGNKPASGTDAEDIIGTDEDSPRALATISISKAAMENALSEIGLYSADNKAHIDEMTGLMANSVKASDEYKLFMQRVNQGIKDFIQASHKDT
jgi:hypothetical protein